MCLNSYGSLGEGMRLFWSAAMGLMAAMASVGVTHGKPIIKEKTEFYAIRGYTGVELLPDMNRRGPRHGFLRKAIAQTRYTATPRGDLVHRDGVCRAEGAGIRLDMTFVYPKPSHRLPPDLDRRWRIFQADNIRHEQVHGRIARQMAVELDRVLAGFSMKDRSGCWRSFRRLKAQTEAIYSRYEKMQNEFDAREHRDGGAVEKSVRILVEKGRPKARPK